ncbi:MAG: glycosyltransferase family 39 protein [Phycisphaerales bacterium]|nr:glycosyltransferase family 39 protein [Phycisphaerales bacterium]
MKTRPNVARDCRALLVLVACVLVYWLGLGAMPFGSSEGHRVIPGWTMLQSGDWWHVRLFGQPYLRKPPGMPWAIAASSSVLGLTEFGARAPSALAATLAALAALWFGTRWFGRLGGLGCGLMQATLPLFWAPGRSAEIEALNNFGTQLAALALIDLALSGRAAGGWMDRLRTESAATTNDFMRIGPAPASDIEGRRPPPRPVLMALLGAAGAGIAGLTKGPAGLPVLAGALIGSVIGLGSIRAILRSWTFTALAIAGAALWWIGREVLAANSDPDTIRQGAEAFMWTGGRSTIGKVLFLAPMALASALPASLAMMFPWGADARREAASSPSNTTRRAYAAARSLAWCWVVAIGVMVICGVQNARYAMPAAFVFPMLCGYVLRGGWGVWAGFDQKRRTLARRLTFRGPASWPVVLCFASVLGGRFVAMRNDPDDSTEAARTVAAALPQGGTLWADDLVEARPDVLLYAQRRAAEVGEHLRPLWKKSAMLAGTLPGPGEFIVVRTDDKSTERRRYGAAVADGKLVLVNEGRVGKFRFEVYRAR